MIGVTIGMFRIQDGMAQILTGIHFENGVAKEEWKDLVDHIEDTTCFYIEKTPYTLRELRRMKEKHERLERLDDRVSKYGFGQGPV